MALYFQPSLVYNGFAFSNTPAQCREPNWVRFVIRLVSPSFDPLGFVSLAAKPWVRSVICPSSALGLKDQPKQLKKLGSGGRRGSADEGFTARPAL
jgi:hypothetical protein